MGVWNAATPAGSDNVRDGDDRIRELKVAIAEALTANDATLGDAGVFPGAAPLTAPLYHYRGLRGTSAQIAALTASSAGLAFDTDKSAMYSYAGGSWNAVGYVFPANTQIPFYQAAAPTGWVEISSAFSDYVLNAKTIATGLGGSKGGSWNAVASEASHTHDLVDGSIVGQMNTAYGTAYAFLSGGVVRSCVVGGSGPGLTSVSETTGAGSSHSHAHVLADHAYANVILCKKSAY